MIFETLRMAFKSLSSNKMRTVLSMLGIIIGVAAVLAIISIGSGVQMKITGRISDLGSNFITISTKGEVKDGRYVQHQILTMKVAQALQESCPAVKNIIPSAQSGGMFSWNGKSVQATLEGVEPDYQEMNNYYPETGQFISPTDQQNAQNVISLGHQLALDIFGETDPLGKKIQLSIQGTTHLFTVIGVMQEKDNGIMGDLNSRGFIPISVYMGKVTNSRYVNSFIAQATTAKEAADAVGQIKYFLRKYFNEGEEFDILSQDQILDVVNEVSGSLSLMLGGIAAISLLVGGIGIMNIMLVSVTERTREIGIRKALGAKKKHILSQFVIESLSLSGLGGLIGLVLGWLGALGLSKVGDWPLMVSGLSIMLAYGFALIIGLFFGIYPAVKASKLDPVQALSYE